MERYERYERYLYVDHVDENDEFIRLKVGDLSKIRINNIRTTNFKLDRIIDLYLNKDLTEIVGKNNAGKTTIVDAITFAFLGVDSMGKKQVFANNKINTCSVKLEFMDKDRRTHVIERTQTISKTGSKSEQLFINNNKYKVTEFKKTSNIDQDLFLSIVNPNYFFSLSNSQQTKLLSYYLDVDYDKVVNNIYKYLDIYNHKEQQNLFNTPKRKEKALKEITELEESIKFFQLLKHRTKSGHILKCYNISRGKTTDTYSYKFKDKVSQEYLELVDSLIEGYVGMEVVEDITTEVVEDLYKEVKSEQKELEQEITILNRMLVSLKRRLGFAELETVLDINVLDKDSKVELRVNKKRIDKLKKEVEELDNKFLALTGKKERLDKEEGYFKTYLNSELNLISLGLKPFFKYIDIVTIEGEKEQSIKHRFDFYYKGILIENLSNSESVLLGLEMSNALMQVSKWDLPIIIDNAECLSSFDKSSLNLNKYIEDPQIMSLAVERNVDLAKIENDKLNLLDKQQTMVRKDINDIFIYRLDNKDKEATSIF